MLVVSGTEEMFEDLEETFSPIPRSFKRINVSNFDDIQDTAECILKPLEKEEREMVDDKTISDIHNISNGSPHEINLIMHQVYKYYKREEKDELALSTQVLESVLDEIDRLRDERRDEIIREIKSLTDLEMGVLASLFEVSGPNNENLSKYALLNEIKFTEMNSVERIIEENRKKIDSLEEDGFITVENGQVQWKIDEFDKLYLKYYILSNSDLYLLPENISFNSPDMTILANKLNHMLSKDTSSIMSNLSKIIDHSDQEVSDRPNLAPGESLIETKEDIERVTIALPEEFDGDFDFPREIEEKMDKEVLENMRSTAKEMISGDGITTESSETISYTCHVSWLEKTITNKVHLENTEEKDEFRKNINNIKKDLKGAGIHLYLENLIDLRQKGWDYIEEEDWSSAQEIFERAEEIVPQEPNIRHGKAITLFEQGHKDKSLELVNDLLENSPRWIPGLYLKSMILKEKQEWEEALKFSSKLVEEDRSSPASWDLHTNLVEQAKDYCFELQEFKESDMNMAEVEWTDNQNLFKGVILLRMKEYDSAKELLQTPDINTLAILSEYITKRELDEADKNAIVEILLNIDACNPQEILTKAVCLLDLGELEKSENMLKGLKDRQIEDQNLRAEIFYNLSCVFGRKGDAEPAVDNLEKSIHIDEELRELAEDDPDLDEIRDHSKFKDLISKK